MPQKRQIGVPHPPWWRLRVPCPSSWELQTPLVPSSQTAIFQPKCLQLESFTFLWALSNFSELWAFSFLFSLKKKKTINWRTSALQCCVDFCHTSTWISHRYTFVPSLLNLPPTSNPIPPLSVVTKYQAEFPASYSNSPLALRSTYGSVHASTLLCQSLPPSPSPAASASLVSTSASLLLPWKQAHQYHFSRSHVYVLLYDICLSVSDSLHSV